jgi:hypothetical protein
MLCHIKPFLIGMLIGDGSIKKHKGYKNARYSFKHSIHQKEYFLWKVSRIDQISSEKCHWSQNNDSTINNKQVVSNTLRYQSRALPFLTDIYQITHKRGIKGNYRIWRKWLNILNEESIAIWWLDDGSIVSNTNQGVLCTDSFNLKDIKVINLYLKKVWNISTKIHPVMYKGKLVRKKDGTNSYRLWIRSRTELKIFIRLILPHVPVPSMLYKCSLIYKDPQLQQRWISEMVTLSRFDEKTINSIIITRKSKIKVFQRMI